MGLLDADVYGPSQPRMLGVSGRPVSWRRYGGPSSKLWNKSIHGVLVPDDTAMIWPVGSTVSINADVKLSCVGKS